MSEAVMAANMAELIAESITLQALVLERTVRQVEAEISRRAEEMILLNLAMTAAPLAVKLAEESARLVIALISAPLPAFPPADQWMIPIQFPSLPETFISERTSALNGHQKPNEQNS